MTAKEFLASKTVGDVLQLTWMSDHVITIPSTASVSDAIKILSEKKIQAAPVVDASHKLVGLLQIYNIMRYTINKAKKSLSISDAKKESWEKFLKTEPHFGDAPVTAIFDEDPIKSTPQTLRVTNTLEKAVEMFAMGVFKILVVAEDGAVTHILSHSAVAKFFMQTVFTVDSLKPLLEKSLQDLALVQGKDKIVSVDVHTPVLKCLDLLEENHVGALPIEREGKAIGNFSAKDIKGITEAMFPQLLIGVADFLDEHNKSSMKLRCVKPSNTLGEVIVHFPEYKVHRLWVVDDDGAAIGCVALADIFRLLLKM